MQALAVPPGLQDGRQVRRLLHQVGELVQDQAEPLLKVSGLVAAGLGDVAQQGIPGDGDLGGVEEGIGEGVQQLGGKVQPLLDGGGLVGQKVAVGPRRLVGIGGTGEEALEQVGLAQAAATVEHRHLAAALSLCPRAGERGEFALAVEEGFGLNDELAHNIGIMRYGISCYGIVRYARGDSVIMARFRASVQVEAEKNSSERRA